MTHSHSTSFVPGHEPILASFPITPSRVRYIKLGVGNAWFPDCRIRDRLEFGHKSVPHEVATAGDRTAIAAIYRGQGRTPGKASGYAREVMDFYDGDEACLWITFADGCLWWGFAKADVEMLEETAERGRRARTMLTSWSNRDANGQVLINTSLSTSLTQVGSYRQTICAVKAAAYAIRRINAIDDPAVAAARHARQELQAAARGLIANLHWRDFEILTDLIFTRLGWQRLSDVGGDQKDTDLVLIQPATGERAFVQVKSRSDQTELSGYEQTFQSNPGFERMFYVCHTYQGVPELEASGKPVHFWHSDEIARLTIAAGLFDWLIDRAG